MERYAVVTGASNGIGMELARILSARGYALILAARRRDRLEALARELPTPAIPVAADLTDPAQRRRLLEVMDGVNVEVFINNAGFGDCGKFWETSPEKEQRMIDLNVSALHSLTKEVLRRFLARNSGFLLNVASSAGLLPAGPYMATYYATKAYVTSLTLAIHRELKEAGSGVYVGALCPGPVDTGFNAVANVEFALPGISARRCAACAVTQMFRRKVLIVPTLPMKAAIALSRFLPRSALVAISARQQKKKFYRKPTGKP